MQPMDMCHSIQITKGLEQEEKNFTIQEATSKRNFNSETKITYPIDGIPRHTAKKIKNKMSFQVPAKRR